MNNKTKLETCKDRALVFMTISGVCIVAAAITGYSLNADYTTGTELKMYQVCAIVLLVSGVATGFISWIFWKGYEDLRQAMYIDPKKLNRQAGVDRH